MKHTRAAILSIAFTAVLAVSGLLTLLLPSRSFSPNENRYLQTTPQITGAGLLKGSSQEEIAQYMNDQFPLRDLFTATGSAVKKWLGRRDIGGAYLGKDGWYFEKVTDADISLSRYTRNLNWISDFMAQYPQLQASVMLVPSSGTVLPQKLPAFAQLYDAASLYTLAESALPAGTLLDLRQPLSKAAETAPMYYRTDHHWTTAGAAVAYTAYTGKPAPALTTVSDSFLGTLYSDTLDIAAVPDSVALAEIAPTVTALADGKEIAVYHTESLREKDQYRVFLGGNHGLVVLTGGCQNGKTLLMIKDSFANCLAPMLTADYETVVMLDLRYFDGRVSTVVEEYGADSLLVCFELDKFAGDSNLAKLAE